MVFLIEWYITYEFIIYPFPPPCFVGGHFTSFLDTTFWGTCILNSSIDSKVRNLQLYVVAITEYCKFNFYKIWGIAWAWYHSKLFALARWCVSHLFFSVLICIMLHTFACSTRETREREDVESVVPSLPRIEKMSLLEISRIDFYVCILLGEYRIIDTDRY